VEGPVGTVAREFTRPKEVPTMDDPGQRMAEAARTLIQTGLFRARFAAWSERFPAFTLIRGPDDLLGGLRRHSYRIRDGLLAALVNLFKEGDTDATLILLAILRPGIGARAGWLEGSLGLDEAWQEMTAAVLWAAHRYDPARFPTGIARNLLHAAWRHAEPARRLHLEAKRLGASLTEVVEERKAEVWADPLPTARMLIAEATQSGAISPEEAGLIRATRLDGLPLKEVVAGEPYHRTQKRRRRAEARLGEFAMEHYPACVRNGEPPRSHSPVEGADARVGWVQPRRPPLPERPPRPISLADTA